MSVIAVDGIAAAAEDDIPESILGASDFFELPTDDGYSAAYFNHTEEATEFFQSRGLRSDGETWEALVRAGMELEWSLVAGLVQQERSSFLDSIRFYRSSYALSMNGPDAKSIAAIALIIARLESDPDFRGQCLDHARSLGYLE